MIVSLVQINNSFSGQNYLPYSVACLQAYAQKFAKSREELRFLPAIFKRMPVRDIVARSRSAQVVGFSVYVWNIRISLEAARRLKAENPNILIVMGGPQIPDNAEQFLRDNPQVDVVCHGEGEATFAAILDAFAAGESLAVAGTSLIAAGQFVKSPRRERMRNLDDLPSPFLNGIFDELMRDNPQERWIGLWETNRGCPFKCSYCDWGSATFEKVAKFGEDRLLAEADWFSDHGIEYLFCCDANFGMLARDLDIAERVAANRRRTGFPQGFSVQNTKNATERAYATQKIISDAGLNKGVTLSVQSLSPEALKNTKRDNIALETYFELMHRFTADKVETYTDLILGLPGETYDSFVDGIDTLLHSGPNNKIRIHNCVVLPNAEMGDPDYIRRFGLDLVETEIVNIHGCKESQDDDVPEMQSMVVATASLSREDWRRSRSVAWMSAFLHSDKILQIPLVLIHHTLGIGYRQLFDLFMEVDAGRYPLLAEIRDFFISEALRMQHGGVDYTHAPDWLNIYWPTDEYVYIKLTVDKTVERFYAEAGALLAQLVRDAGGGELELGALEDAVRLNAALLHQPFVFDDTDITLGHNVWQYYQGVLNGAMVDLVAQPDRIAINRSGRAYADFDAWCREIVWWGNKKGAYLYTNTRTNTELAGHY
ncbi:MAG: B12-binding domain-containing radical SAM protein [Bacteroidota bacterium]